MAAPGVFQGPGTVFVGQSGLHLQSKQPDRHVDGSPEAGGLLQRLPATTYVLIDEAYHDYVGGSADYGWFIDCPVDDPRLIVTRSLSNVYGLAGAAISP
jgi:Aminotransferase class I and II